ncbi:MAG: hypothetical protein AB8B73_11265 [Ekhidna sp.]
MLIEDCSTCKVSENKKSLLQLHNINDSIWITSFDPAGHEVPNNFALCNPSNAIHILENGSIVKSGFNILNDCNGIDFAEMQTLNHVINCPIPFDTLNIESSITDNWKLYLLNDSNVPCELEPSRLSFYEKDNSLFSASALNWVSSARIKGDSIFLYDHVFSLFGFSTSNGSLFSNSLSDLFVSRDTTK